MEAGGAHEHDPSGGEHLVPELRGYFRQFAGIEREAKVLLEGLTERQLTWRENASTWSIAEIA
jgi:hypothetical protein